MVKIIKSNITNEIKSKLREVLKDSEILNPIVIDNYSEDYKIHYIQSDDSLVAFCIYSEIDKERLVEELNLSSSHFDCETMDEYKEMIKDMREDTLYIDILECIEKGYGYGKKLVESMIELNKDIVLYSSSEAETFWKKNDFVNIFGYEYMYEMND